MDSLGKTPSLIYKSLGNVPRVGVNNTLPLLPGNSFPHLRETASFAKRHTLVLNDGKRDAKPFSTSHDASANGETSASADCTDPLLEIDPSPPFATLRFFGYVEEPVYDSALETKRYTGVSVLYFTEDATVALSTPNVANSGTRGGVLLARTRVAAKQDLATTSSSDTPNYIGPSMLRIGQAVALHGRVVHLIDADATTRAWYSARGVTIAPPLPPPSHLVPTATAPKACQTLLPPSGRKVVPAQMSVLSKPAPYVAPTPTPAADIRVAASKYRAAGGEEIVLRFSGIIDERSRPNGLVRHVTVYYFVTDRNVKVVLSPSMMRAAREFGDSNGLLAGRHARPDLTPRDFLPGRVVRIYSRLIKIVSCDASTQSYLVGVEGCDASEVAGSDDVDATGVETVVVPQLRAPKVVANVDTIGQSRLSGAAAIAAQAAAAGMDATTLSRGVVKGNMSRGVVRLLGRAVVRNLGESEGARYILSFNCSDQSVVVYANQPRNSGSTSGVYLSRSHPTDPETGAPYTLDRLMSGAPVVINGREFVFEYLSDRRAALLPVSEMVRLVRDRLWSHYIRPSEAFVGLDKNRCGRVSVLDVVSFLSDHALLPDSSVTYDATVAGCPATPVEDVEGLARVCGLTPTQVAYAAVVHYVMDRDDDGVVSVNDFTAFLASNDVVPPHPRPDPEEAMRAAEAAIIEPRKTALAALWMRLKHALDVRTRDTGDLFRRLSGCDLAARLLPSELRVNLERMQLGFTAEEVRVVVSRGGGWGVYVVDVIFSLYLIAWEIVVCPFHASLTQLLIAFHLMVSLLV